MLALLILAFLNPLILVHCVRTFKQTTAWRGAVFTSHECYVPQFSITINNIVLLFNEPDYLLLVQGGYSRGDNQCMTVFCIKLNYILVDQRYFHVVGTLTLPQRYMYLKIEEAKCVKCAGKHHNKECRKPKEAQPKCVHCREVHPADYRGCSVAIELQKIKTQNMKAKRANLPQRQSATKPRQANNTTKVRNQSSILQKKIGK